MKEFNQLLTNKKVQTVLAIAGILMTLFLIFYNV